MSTQPARQNTSGEWQDTYRDMLSTPANAVKKIKPGQRVFIGTGCGQPTELINALTARANELADVEIIQLLTKGEAPYANRKLADSFTVNSFFIGTAIRGHIQEGLGDYTPPAFRYPADIPFRATAA